MRDHRKYRDTHVLHSLGSSHFNNTVVTLVPSNPHYSTSQLFVRVARTRTEAPLVDHYAGSGTHSLPNAQAPDPRRSAPSSSSKATWAATAVPIFSPKSYKYVP